MGIDQSSLLPNEFYLEQNYPNPFNPQTTIRYAIPKPTNVKIVIYDIEGKKIDILNDGKHNAGYYEVIWNASNYSTGVYFYKIEAGNFVDIKKCILMK